MRRDTSGNNSGITKDGEKGLSGRGSLLSDVSYEAGAVVGSGVYEDEDE